MGLNVSNNQIAEQLDLNRSDVQQMTYLFREGIVKKTKVIFQNKVEFDEVYIVIFRVKNRIIDWSCISQSNRFASYPFLYYYFLG